MTHKKVGWVYVIVALNGLTKIGRTANLKQRFKGLEMSSPIGLNLWHSIRTDNTFRLERIIHEQFEKQRKHGEWFDLSKKDLMRIQGQNEIFFGGVPV